MDAPDTWPRWRLRLHEIIFEAETPEGFAFDVGLIAAIVLSVGLVIAGSVQSVHESWGGWLVAGELVFTALFTVEYVLRLLSVRKPWAYATSFFGIIDLVAILPTWLAILVPGAAGFMALRTLRLLRIFRVFKLAHYLNEAKVLVVALRRSQRKITVFLSVILSAVVAIGAMMHSIEGPAHGFDDIPTGMYWAIVTMTTVGYGDISPGTPLGKLLASVVMLAGYGILAVPTGIVSSELMNAGRPAHTTQCCPACSAEGHENDAVHCRFCGAHLADGRSVAPPTTPA